MEEEKDADKLERWKNLLDEHHRWPVEYTFKFVVPERSRIALESALHEERTRGQWQTRASSRGKYVSITLRIPMSSSDAVLAVYEKARTVDGLIAF